MSGICDMSDMSGMSGRYVANVGCVCLGVSQQHRDDE